MIYYKSSNHNISDFFEDILKLNIAQDKKCNNENLKTAFKKNKESYILAYRGMELIGYICFFPISKQLSSKIQNTKSVDDKIKPDDILSKCPENKETDVVIISVAVLRDYQNKGIAKELANRLFATLSEKIQAGCKIKNVFGYCYTTAGASLCHDYGFNFHKQTQDHYIMRYTFDDFQGTNMYMFAPFSTDKHAHIPHTTAGSAGDKYIKHLERVSKNEFNAALLKKLKREFIGREKFVLVDDEDKTVIGTRECNIYVTHYNEIYVATFTFESFGMDPTILLNQASNHRLYIQQGQGAKTHNISFTDYIAERFGLKHNEVHYAGVIRSFTSLNKKPLEVHLAHMLACENYIKGYVSTFLTSEEYFFKARRNIAQYDFSKIYCSERNVVFLLKPPDPSDKDYDRFDYESLMIYILELLSLQLSAINSSYNEIMQAMEKSKFNTATIDRINNRSSRGALLWDVNSFIYPAAACLFENISKEFGVHKLKSEYRENLSMFEKLCTMRSQKEIKRYSKTTQNYFMFFSVLSGIGTLGSIVGLIMDSSAGVTKSIITLVSGIISAGIFVTCLVLIRRNHKRALEENPVKNKKNKGVKK